MKRLLLALALCLPAFAARTTVADALVKTTGGFCAGTLSISNPAFTSIDGPIAAATVTSTINAATGGFSISLEPGDVYTVTYVVASSGCTPTVEYWNVPVSATPVDLATVRSISPPPPLPNTIPLSYITQSGAATGQYARWDGTTWVPATGSGTGALIANTTSALKGDGAGNGLAVTGTGTNCVLVNGSSAACSNGSGDVVGPSSATDNAIARFDSTTGKLIQNSLVTIDDSGNISTPGTITAGAGGSDPGTVTPAPATVATLPTCDSGLAGGRASVTDANSTTFLASVAGGGSNKVPVFCDGSAWKIG